MVEGTIVEGRVLVMKIFRKSTGIFTLLFMLCNFFVAPIADVFADESSEVEKYIADIKSLGDSINSQITAEKVDSNCSTNSNCIKAVEEMKNEFSSMDSEFSNFVDEMGSSISVKKVLGDTGSSKLEEFNLNFSEDIIVSFSNIQDITYEDDVNNLTVTLITGEELASLINQQYFSSYYNSFNDFNNNFSNRINIATSIPVENTSDNGSISSSSVKSNNTIKKSGNLTIFENFDDVSVLNNKMDTINNLYSNLETDFNNICSKYEIDYKNISDQVIKNFLVSDIDSLVDVINDGFTIDSNNNPADLIDEVNEYIADNPSDESLLNSNLMDLENYYNNLNLIKLYDIYKLFVYNVDSSVIGNYDALFGFKYFGDVNSERDYLIKQKNLSYLSFNSDKYMATEEDGYIIIDNANSLTKDDFEAGITYNGASFISSGEGNIINSSYKVDVYTTDGAGNDILLRTLKIALMKDVNGDGVLDNNDVKSLKNKLLFNKFNDLEKIVCDLNNDKVINVKDLIMLNNLFNGSTQGTTTKASFDVAIYKTDKQVTYNIYLKTNGAINAFEFNINPSDNLKILSINSLTGVDYNTNDSVIRVVGLGKYINGDLLFTLKCEIINNEVDSNISLDNGVLIFDTNEIVTDYSTNNIIKADTNTGKTQVRNLVNKVEDNSSNEKITLDEFTGDSNDDNAKKSAISDKNVSDNGIAWGNIIKITLIVLLGTLVIYFLNRDSKKEESKEFLKDNPKKDVKSNKDKS